MSDHFEQFKSIFIIECNELLEDMESRLLSLDLKTADSEELNAIFRCAHSIKGGSGALGLSHIANFTHALETLLDPIRDGKIPVTKQIVDLLLKSADALKQLVRFADEGLPTPNEFGADLKNQLNLMIGNSVKTIVNPTEIDTQKEEAIASSINRYLVKFTPHKNLFLNGNEPLLLIRELKKLGNATIVANIDNIPFFDNLDPNECYCSWEISLESNCNVEKVKEVFEFVEDDCDLSIEKIEELKQNNSIKNSEPTPAALQEKLPIITASEIVESQDKKTKPASSVASIRVDIDKIDKLVNMVGELVITQSMFYAQLKNIPAEKFPDLVKGIDSLSQHSRELQEAVMSVRMQPVKSIFGRMTRVVHDLAMELGKDIKLETRGEDTEVDKTIIEQLTDPLTHMMRNSVDHGIEMPEVRIATNKPAQGIIKLSAFHQGGQILIEIEDNGGGINREKVLQKTKEKGLIKSDAILTGEAIDNLIFLPGLSTAETVTAVSGRGVGMDVVKRNIEAIGGKVSIYNRPGQGTKFTISLPLTLAILDGMIVQVGKEHYIIPIGNITEATRAKQDDIQTLASGGDVSNIRGEFIDILYLADLFDVKNSQTDINNCLVILLESGKERFGLIVDELIGQQQVVIKSIEENSNHIEGVSGATILGDGKVALILDISRLKTINNNIHRK